MYACDDYLLLHQPKTGGTYAAQALRGRYEVATCQHKHLPVRYMPEKYADRTILGILRNPFAWYVSAWCFERQLHSRFGSLSFAQYVEQFCRSPWSRTAYRWYMPRSVCRMGAYSYAHVNVFCRNARAMFRCRRFSGSLYRRGLAVQQWIRTESMSADMLALCGVTVEEPEYWNATHHRHYRRYYDNSTRQLVEELDGYLTRRYGYSF